MRIIPKLKSMELDSDQNLVVSILLGNSSVDLSNCIRALIFSNSEGNRLEFFPTNITEDQLTFVLDKVGIRKLFETGISWKLNLEVQILNDIFLIKVENTAQGEYSQKLNIELENKEYVLNVYFNDEYQTCLFATFIIEKSILIQDITNVEFENNKIQIEGRLSSIDGSKKDLYLYALPISKDSKFQVKSFKLITSRETFYVDIPLEYLEQIKNYYIIFGYKHNDIFYTLSLNKVEDTLNKNVFSVPFNEGGSTKQIKCVGLLLHYYKLVENNILPVLEDITYNQHFMQFKIYIHSDAINEIEIINSQLVHRKSGHSYDIKKLEKINESTFELIIELFEGSYFGLSGVYDLHINAIVNGIMKKLKVFIGSEEYIITEPILHTSNSGLSKVRPYKTADNSIAFVSYIVDSIHELKEVQSVGNAIQILSEANINNLQYEVLSVRLKLNETDYTNLEFISDENHKLQITINSNQLSMLKNELLFNDGYIEITYKLEKHTFKDVLITKNEINSLTTSYPIYKFGEDLYVYPYLSSKRNLYFKISNSPLINLTKINSDKKHLILTVKQYEDIQNLQYRLVVMDKLNHLPVRTFELIKSTGNNDEYECIIEYKQLLKNIDNGKYYLGLQITDQSNTRKVSPIIISDETLLKQSEKKEFKQKIVSRSSFALQNHSKSLQIEIKTDISNAQYKGMLAFKKIIAKALAKMTKPFSHKETWLIGENLGLIARDNGLSFFKYCYEKNKLEDFYYVAKKNNFDLHNLSSYKNRVVYYDTFKHYYLYYKSKYLFVSHGIRDVIPSLFHSKIRENQKSIIYLQHGIIAMKKLYFNSKSYNGKIKKFVVSSEQEKNIVVKDMKFREDQVMITGLSRFDYLTSEVSDKKEILLMPTWREWLINSEEEFLKSKFYNEYYNLINNKELGMLLEKNQIIIKFVLHVEMLKYSHYFTTSSDYIEIVEPENIDIQSLIKSAQMLITDYSSISFDFAYLEKPIIFYQFDLEEYLEHRGAYVNLSQDLPGYNISSADEFIITLKRILDNEFKLENHLVLRAKKFFAYNDKENSDRIYREVKNLR